MIPRDEVQDTEELAEQSQYNSAQGVRASPTRGAGAIIITTMLPQVPTQHESEELLARGAGIQLRQHVVYGSRCHRVGRAPLTLQLPARRETILLEQSAKLNRTSYMPLDEQCRHCSAKAPPRFAPMLLSEPQGVSRLEPQSTTGTATRFQSKLGGRPSHRIPEAASVSRPSTVVITPFCVSGGISNCSSGTLAVAQLDFTTCT